MRLKYVNMLRFVLLTMLVLSACSSRAQVQNTASDKPPTLASGFKSILDTFQPIYNSGRAKLLLV